ncbi:MAG TPA: CocE/NonD family hydrolase [Sphingomonas sp.]|nr:CocE/NonD family hydrolase [Sphingomonas sp.]
MADFDLRLRPGMRPADAGHPGLNPRRENADGMVIDRDYAITLRDGVKIYADVFRPADATGVPVIIGWGPYGKFAPPTYHHFYKFGGMTDDMVSKYTAFEAPDPVFWTAAGYAVAIVDPRGAWESEGNANLWGAVKEGEDAYDVIEALAIEPWCNGRVGMSGVSYFTIIQWRAAAAKPPHLAAINPWEGFRDPYRETAYIGGIADRFVQVWQMTSGWSHNEVENVWQMMEEHPLFDDYWASKVADLSDVDVPAYIVASWSDQGLHTRGTISAFNELKSKDKWLEVHGRKKWEYYYTPEALARQRQFFDRFLKGEDSGIDAWPRVRLELRDRYYQGEVREGQEWPPACVEYRPLYLDNQAGSLTDRFPADAAAASYSVDADMSARAYHDDRLEYDHVFDRDTEVTGDMKLRLWVQAAGADDMDVFVAIQKFDAAGNYVGFPFFSAQEDGPVALGWLRVSHRALDEERSTPWRPVHLHTKEETLAPDEIVPIDIEIWPSSTLFRAGEKLRVVIQGTDVYSYGEGKFTPNHITRNAGRHVVHAGGRFDSHLLIPVANPASA